MSHVSLSLADTRAPPSRTSPKSGGGGGGGGAGGGGIGLSEVGARKLQGRPGSGSSSGGGGGGGGSNLKSIPEGRVTSSSGKKHSSGSSSSSTSSGSGSSRGGGGGGGAARTYDKKSRSSSVGRALGKRASDAAAEGLAVDPSRAAMWQQVLHAPSPPNSARVHIHGGAAAPTTTTAAEPALAPTESKTKQLVTNAKAVCDKIMKSRILVSLVVFLTTTILLLVINPPMAQEPRAPDAPPDQRAARSWKKIMVWSTLAMLMALVLPYTCGAGGGGGGGGGGGTSCLVKTPS